MPRYILATANLNSGRVRLIQRNRWSTPMYRPGFDAPGVCQLFAVFAMAFACVLHFIMSSCAFHFAYVFVSCIRAFSPLFVFQSGTHMSSGAPFYLFSCAGVKLSRNGPSLAKRPWYSTGRPPIKFRAIWRSFDTPTVNRVTAKPSFVAAQHPLQSGPKPI